VGVLTVRFEREVDITKVGTFVIGSLILSACDLVQNELVGVYEAPVTMEFPSHSTQSFYLNSRDGVRLAVDVHIPQPLSAGVQLPAILVMTRYWRSEYDREQPYMGWRIDEATRRGYAMVLVDERGTGASFGTWRHPWTEDSRLDFAEVVDWVVAQPWSNGRVGAWGISYLGMTAQLLPASGHPALRASIPTFTQYDLYTDIAFPGGIFNDLYVEDWRTDTRALDLNSVPGRSVKSVDEDVDGTLLEAAVAEHAGNGDVYEGFKNVTYRDELSQLLGIAIDDISAHTSRDAIERSEVPLYHWGSWLDHGSANAVLARFLTLGSPQQAVIGAWTHGGFEHASPYATPSAPPLPSEEAQWNESLNFLSKYLMGDEAASTERVLHYYTMGAEEWRQTAVWPPDGTTLERWYLSPNNSLTTTAPSDPDGRDEYSVDFTATTGNSTRWHTDEILYSNRYEEDRKLLTYTSEPLTEDTEITGHTVVTLFVSSTHADGAFYVYLEDVSPSGRVTYVTDGQLRALHRNVSTEQPPYELPIPYHSFESGDGEPLVPGEIAELSFGLLPTSVVVKAGQRIRIAIAGHDTGLFARIPAIGDPVITVERNSIFASMIELPIVRR
jgi:putative CocE/NonD family hydrolase